MPTLSVADLLLQNIKAQQQAAAQLYQLNRKPVPLSQPEGAGTANAPGAALAPLARVLEGARENMAQVAEAEVRLAAAGKVSVDSLDQQRKALEFLTARRKQEGEEEKKVGKNAVTLIKAFDSVQASLLTASATLTGTFFTLRHLAGSAHPGYLRAFDGAIGILQTRLAGELLPVFDSVIDKVMDAADWFEGLSDGAKKLVAGGMVAIPAAIGLGSALRALSPVLMLAAAATRKMTAAAQQQSLISSRMGAAVGAVGAVGTLGAIAYFLGAEPQPGENHSLRPNEEEVRYAIKTTRETAGGDALNYEEFAALPREQQQQYATKNAERMRGYIARDERHFFNRRGYTYLEDGQAERTADVLERLAKVGKEGLETKEESGLRKRIQRQTMRVSAIQQENQPHFSPLAEARKQLQLQILGKNRYEQEILREQRKHRTEEIKRLDRLIDEFRQRFPQARLYD